MSSGYKRRFSKGHRKGTSSLKPKELSSLPDGLFDGVRELQYIRCMCGFCISPPMAFIPLWHHPESRTAAIHYNFFPFSLFLAHHSNHLSRFVEYEKSCVSDTAPAFSLRLVQSSFFVAHAGYARNEGGLGLLEPCLTPTDYATGPGFRYVTVVFRLRV